MADFFVLGATATRPPLFPTKKLTLTVTLTVVVITLTLTLILVLTSCVSSVIVAIL